MPKFHWSGRTIRGQEISGEMEAAVKDDVVRSLQARKITVSSVSEKNQGDMTTSLEPSATRPSAMGRIVFIVLAILAICMCIGLIRKFIG